MPSKRIFVSCGQETDEEKSLGRDILAVIDTHGMKGFSAQEVHSPTDLNTEVFRAIQKCDAFFAVMHRRGEVVYRDFPRTHRSSVWIQQEIAIFCYRMFLQERHVPVRVYMETGVLLEGLMKTTIVNPLYFETRQEVLDGLSKWLTGPEFQVHPVLDRRESLFQKRTTSFSPEQWLVLELIAAHTVTPGDEVNGYVVSADFSSLLKEQGLADSQIKTSFNDAIAQLASMGLITVDRTAGRFLVTIGKQWWELLLEELRLRGRVG